MKTSIRILHLLLLLVFSSSASFAQMVGDYRSVGTGNWTAVTTWQMYNGTSWVTPIAEGYPGQNAGNYAVTIQAGHTILISNSGISTAVFGTITINGHLILTGKNNSNVDFNFNTMHFIISTGGVVEFLDKSTLILPEGAILNVTCGGLAGDCSNNQEIQIGLTTYSYCVGGGGIINFDEVMLQGGNGEAFAFANPDTICNGQSTILTLTGMVGFDDAIHWYSGSCGGAPVGIKNNLIVTPNSTTDYYGRYEYNVSCGGSYISNCGTVRVTVNPVPSCSISGSVSVSPGSANNSYTSTVIPADNVSHSWSITGNGTLTGSTSGATVTVDAGSAGSFRLTDNISRLGCTSLCAYDVIVCGISPVTASVTKGTSTTFTAPANMDTYNWFIAGDGVITGGGATGDHTVTVLAGNCNTYTINLTITKGTASSTCSQTVSVIDSIPPTFSLPADSVSLCANSIINAAFKANPIDPEYDDLTTPRPEYYRFNHGSTVLNLAPVACNFADNCCAVNTLVLHWRIEFSPTPDTDPTHIPLHSLVTKAPITDQIGQPSDYGSDILFPSDGVNFTDVTHKIFYWLVDCNANSSAEKTVNITIKPLPRIIK